MPLPLSGHPAAALSEARALYSVKTLADILGRGEATIRRWLKHGNPDPLVVPALRAHLEAGGGDGRATGSKFTFIDLFAGIGGLRRAFEDHGGRCVWTSEWNAFAVRTYRANFPCEHEIAGDITTVPAGEVPDHDVLVAGFPCQPFSLAGVSKKNSLGRAHGFQDATQGTLFFDVARVLDAKRPKAFLLENVKNLLSHDKGRTFKVIRRTLEEELGYHLHTKVLDAAPWVPQRRERIVVIGFREPVPFTWSALEIPSEGPRLKSVLHAPDEKPEPPYTESRRGKTNVSTRYTLSDHLWTYLRNYAAKHAARGNGFGCSVAGPEDVARTLSARYYKDGSEILVSRGPGKTPRRLTPRECARLMGFDTPDRPPMRIPVSDTQAYKQFGNAVAVPVFREAARVLVPHLEAIGASSPAANANILRFKPDAA